MKDLVLVKGNEALAEAAILAGCRYFFGYPITPQTEVPEYMARRLPEVGGVYLQAESEIGAINMVYGAAGAGARVMTSSSGPGISLKQEGISYLAGAELPCVIVNMVRGGPGLGNVHPAQSDYYQATRGGGHGDYRVIVYAPESIQEMVDLVYEAFDIADKYRNPVMIYADGILGQMMEPVRFPKPKEYKPDKPWATTGKKGRPRNLISSLYIVPEECEAHNWRLKAKYDEIERTEVRYEEVSTANADIFIVAYGTTARISKTAMELLKTQGINVGLIRPITLWPFPVAPFKAAARRAKAFLVVEMSTGQLMDDVKLAVEGKAPVHFYGRTGGMVPTPREIANQVAIIAKKKGSLNEAVV